MDGEGFEPPVLSYNTPVFKTGTFNRSDTHPKRKTRNTSPFGEWLSWGGGGGGGASPPP
jgi:hypothetical protein